MITHVGSMYISMELTIKCHMIPKTNGLKRQEFDNSQVNQRSLETENEHMWLDNWN